MTVRKRKRDGLPAAGPPAREDSLGSEVELLRGLLRRALDLAAGLEASDPEGDKDLLRLLKVLDSLSRVAARTGRLVVSQRQLEGEGLLAEALREVTERAVQRLSGLEGGEHGPG